MQSGPGLPVDPRAAAGALCLHIANENYSHIRLILDCEGEESPSGNACPRPESAVTVNQTHSHSLPAGARTPLPILLVAAALSL